MLVKRVMTAALLLLGLLACLFWLPNMAWAAVLLLPMVAGFVEWAKLSGLSTASAVIYALVNISLVIVVYYLQLTVWLYLIALLLWLIIVPMWLAVGWQLKLVWLRLPLGYFVLAPLWLALVELRAHGPWWVLLLMAVVWIADSAAYFTGQRFGKHKLAPNISPGKTWEGVAGAVLAVAVYAVIVLTVLNSTYFNPFVWALPVLLLGMLMLYLGILGDLFESWLKRLAAVKDSGNMLPGHGGILDRIDALTSTLPIAALILLHADLLQHLLT